MALVSLLLGCGSGRGGAASADGGVESGGQGDAGLQTDGSAHFVDGSAPDSGTSCSDPLDRAGCPCPSGSAPRQCYTGPAAKAGVGACTFGTQSCMDQGESDGTWGPCTGSGMPTTCAAASAQCGTLSDGCGGTLDCGSCPSGQPCGTANRCGVQSDSCRHLALAYGSANFPSTVCLLAANGSLECAANPADPVSTGAALVPTSTLSQLACISGGEDFFCAVTAAGGVVCWGDETAFDPAHIGTGPLTGSNIVNETLAIPGLTSAIDVAAGETHVCVLTASHTVMCWGNGYGEVNTGSWALPASPTAVDLGGPVTDIASGDGFSCALRQDGVVLCWGNNDQGELGDGTTTASATPVAVTGLPTKAVGVWADQATSPCALLQDGSVWCWGDGAGPPKQVTGFSGPVTALTVGGEFDVSCALLASGGVQCWSGSSSPVDILPGGSGIVELRSLDADYCALEGSGSVTCWYNSGWDPGGVQFGTGVSVPGL
jgi:hypothetical protein